MGTLFKDRSTVYGNDDPEQPRFVLNSDGTLEFNVGHDQIATVHLMSVINLGVATYNLINGYINRQEQRDEIDLHVNAVGSDPVNLVVNALELDNHPELILDYQITAGFEYYFAPAGVARKGTTVWTSDNPPLTNLPLIGYDFPTTIRDSPTMNTPYISPTTQSILGATTTDFQQLELQLILKNNNDEDYHVKIGSSQQYAWTTYSISLF